MSRFFLKKFLWLSLILQSLVFNGYAHEGFSLPEGYMDCVKKMDAQTEKLLSRLNQPPPVFRNTSLEEWERFVKEECSTATPHPNVTIENLSIEGPNGQLGLRIYKPKAEGVLPVFIYLHGGGWTAGSLNHYDYVCQEICEQANCLIVAVDYGQAPRHTYPEPLDDCFFAAEWVNRHIGERGGDAAKIAIGGDSAGANLTAAVTLKARANKAPHFLCQVLLCPTLNYDFDTLSYFEFSEGFFLSREDMKFFWNNYLAHAKDKESPFISPPQADSLVNLPPAFLVIANFDPLRDEGLAYGLRLHREGIPVSIKRFNSIHGFYCFQELDASKEAIASVSSYLRNCFYN